MFTNVASFLTLAALAGSAVTAAPAPGLSKRCSGGQATYFAVGLGNCGWTNQASDYIVALPTSTYAGGSMCGQTITVTNSQNGKSAQATVADSCPSCGSSCDLDMSEGLFSYLNNGNMGAGVFSISWNSGSGSSNSGSSSSSSSSSNNNSNNNKNNNQASSSSSSSSSSKAASSTSSSASASATPKVAPYSQPLANVSSVAPTGKPNATVTTEPSWWAEIDTAFCNINKPSSNVSIAAVGPSKFYNGSDLSDACGKWIEVYNPANKKNVTALVGMWIPDIQENFLALTDGYKTIADMQGSQPNPIANVTWGFVETNDTKSAN